MKIARLIITFDCNRKCYYCSNNYKHIMDEAVTIDSLETLRGNDIVCITGGEPFLYPDRLLTIIRELRGIGIKTIYLYSAQLSSDMNKVQAVMKEIDGIHYTLHVNSTRKDVEVILMLEVHLIMYPNISARLYINSEVEYPVTFSPLLWNRVEMKPCLTDKECVLPEGETLYIYRGGKNALYIGGVDENNIK